MKLTTYKFKVVKLSLNFLTRQAFLFYYPKPSLCLQINLYIFNFIFIGIFRNCKELTHSSADGLFGPHSDVQPSILEVYVVSDVDRYRHYTLRADVVGHESQVTIWRYKR